MPAAHRTRQPRLALPVLAALSLGCLAVAGAELLVNSAVGREKPLVAGVFGVAVIGSGGLWLLRGAVPARWAAACSLGAALLITVTTLMGHIGLQSPAILTAFALATVDLGRRRATALIAGVAVLTSAAALATGAAPLLAVSNTLPVACVQACGVVLGSLMRSNAAALASARQLVRERDAALERLREQHGQEIDLALAHERERAAHDLHDGLGNRLTQIGMSLEFAQRVRGADPESAWEEVEVAREAVRTAVADMRLWVRALAPVRYRDSEGLQGLERVAEAFRGTGLDVSVTGTWSPSQVTQDGEVLVYRAVQEGLTNAVRHAGARHVSISLSRGPAGAPGAGTPDGLLLTIANDLDPDRPGAGPDGPGEVLRGFGLSGLGRRAEELGGRLDTTRTATGFTLRLTLPAATGATEQAGAAEKSGAAGEEAGRG